MTKTIQEGVKENDLENASNKRSVAAYGKLKPIFGEDDVTMSDRVKLHPAHLR